MSSPGSIGVFDSGIGGLSVWREIVYRLPAEDTIYLADQAHVPYGSRSQEEVRGFAEAITRFLLDQGVRAIVLACNTASGTALSYLREKFPDVPFVGMEPAVKPATAHTRSGVIGVIATPSTFDADRFANLVERYGGDVTVLSQTCPGLVEAVESGQLDTPETEALLRACLEPLIEAGIDQLVLGCTHYPFLRPAIERLVGEDVSVIDPAPAVARQTRRVVRHSAHTHIGQHIFYTSGNLAKFAKMVERLAKVNASSRLDCRAVQWLEGQFLAQG